MTTRIAYVLVIVVYTTSSMVLVVVNVWVVVSLIVMEASTGSETVVSVIVFVVVSVAVDGVAVDVIVDRAIITCMQRSESANFLLSLLVYRRCKSIRP